ncbi:MAG: YnbE family lipoprotein [Henriciella sp.]|uniref:YnbE family lipoprotein n=1 Tax=Henriciella sp. TaxID=1968823 RepID=UPI00260BA0CD|nr:YnbE family lipoprotein [Henriciella sp.]
MRHVIRTPILALSAAAMLAACSPTVRLEAPREPITINLNVKIDQEVRVKLDKEVEDLISDNPDLF